ncbi:XTP/dITP diphosphatase [Dehalogenimonas formicexedens]|nr:XTP/dITP diphosphatase [Dehalogenimonas formicexedens]
MEAELLLATNNKGKLNEYRELLAGCGFRLVTPSDKGIVTEVAETGNSFADNAALKARALAKASGLLTLADDSGLEVDALGGEPGVRSARYAGDNATDTGRIDLLLRRLETVPVGKRTARFRCVIAIATPTGQVKFAEGKIEGLISLAPQGRHGFGYDPVFFLQELGKTMAEIAPKEKNHISHRALAAADACLILKDLK